MLAVESDILSLLQSDGLALKRKSNAAHAEFCGACPACGGRDRFIVWPEPRKGKPRYWCRQCGIRGDAITWLRERHHMTFSQACQALGQDAPQPVKRSAPTIQPPRGIDAPPRSWQERASALVDECAAALWTPAARGALAWLRARGLTDDTIRAARLGHNRLQRSEPFAPRGIVIPGYHAGQLVAAKVRRTNDELARHPDYAKYIALAHDGYSGAGWLYGVNALERAKPAVIVESELDALLISQSGLAAGLASGGTDGARRSHWPARIAALAGDVLVSFDSDTAGQEASAWWLERIERAESWPVDGAKDAGDLVRAAGWPALVRWLCDGLALCEVCQEPLARYAPDGAPLCLAHFALYGEPSQKERKA